MVLAEAAQQLDQQARRRPGHQRIRRLVATRAGPPEPEPETLDPAGERARQRLADALNEVHGHDLVGLHEHHPEPGGPDPGTRVAAARRADERLGRLPQDVAGELRSEAFGELVHAAGPAWAHR